jgi:hypothetical protein
MESLGEVVSQLRRGRDLDQLYLSVLNHFVSKVLEDFNVACSRPLMTWFPHPMHAVLSSCTGVGVF